MDLEKALGENIDIDRIGVALSAFADEQSVEFARLYFKKEISELSEEEKHEMDCFGSFGINEWINDHKGQKL